MTIIFLVQNRLHLNLRLFIGVFDWKKIACSEIDYSEIARYETDCSEKEWLL